MRRPLLPLVVALACAAAPASALAATQYASPTGSGSTCTDPAHPCSLSQAVSNANQGDVVQLAAGTYLTGNTITSVGAGVEIRGQRGPARPVISGTDATPLLLNGSGAVARDLAVQNTTGSALALEDGTSAYDVVAHSGGGPTSGGCEAVGDATLVDSVCTAGGSSAAGVFVDPDTAASVSLRGVTAIAAAGDDAALEAMPGSSGSATIDVRNSILRGGASDVVLNGSSGPPTMFASHSNFGTVSDIGTGSHSDDGTIQTVPPVFADAAAGDYREAAGSPTIDAGDNAYADATVDLDGNPRILGTAVDIGAYELVPPPPTVTTGAATGITTAGATLNGSVNPNTNPTQYWFQIGQTTAYGLTTAAQAAPGGAVSQAVGSLSPGTTYHYRLVAQSATGTTFGADQTFTTAVPLSGPPSPRLGRLSQATSNAVVTQLSCSFSLCRLTEKLTVVERINRRTHAVVGVGRTSRRRIRLRTVTVGSQTLSLLAGDSTTSVVKLNAAGRRLLKRFHRLPVKLTVSVAGSNAKPLTATLTIRRSH
jgi:hypothetical protein